jgi:hypothetical protein
MIRVENGSFYHELQNYVVKVFCEKTKVDENKFCHVRSLSNNPNYAQFLAYMNHPLASA